MKKVRRLQHKFVDFIPEKLEAGNLYVSIKYTTASHLCCCGCGEEVVTPIAPTEWTLIFNGDAVSLRPSIGNWSRKCRSHYWIRDGKVAWAGDMSEEDIEAGKRADRAAKDAYFGRRSRKREASVLPSFASLFDSNQVDPSPGNGETPPPKKKGIRERLKKKLHIGEKLSK